jgi:hypothetical protein
MAGGTGFAMLRVSRLLQPRNPLFWLLVVLNALSTAIAFALRNYDLAPVVALVLAGFAIANALIAIRIALKLMAN